MGKIPNIAGETEQEKEKRFTAYKEASVKKIEEMRGSGLATGRRLDILISEDDVHLDDMSPKYFIYRYDLTDQGPGSIRISGTVGEIREEDFNLLFAWDNFLNQPFGGLGNTGYQVNGNAVRDYFPKD